MLRAYRLPAALIASATSICLLYAYKNRKPEHITPWNFGYCKIDKIESVTDDFRKFTFSSPQKLPLIPAISSFYLKNDEMQIQRPYTPFDITDSGFKILVKKYEDGEMSRYLFRQNQGASIGIRGPIPTFSPATTYKHIVMVSLHIIKNRSQVEL